MTNSSTKQQIEQNKILKTIKEYAIMTIGMCIYSFGWIGCVLPAKSTSGAASGLAIVISTALHNTLGWDVKIGTIVLLINVVLLIAAGIILGWNFGIKTIYCIVVLSVAMDVCKAVIPPDLLLTYTQHVDSHNILLVILGAVVAGTGVATSFSQGGSTGGTDIVAMIINK